LGLNSSREIPARLRFVADPIQTTPALITRQRQNLGCTRSRGFEVEADARLNSFWILTAGYLFADATVVRFPTNTALEGLRIPQVPRQHFTF